MHISNLVLYSGEVKKYPMEQDCWQFDTVAHAAKWLYENGHATTVASATACIYKILNEKTNHYKGFTLAVVYIEQGAD